MNTQITKSILGILFLVLTLNSVSAIVVDADYITIYSGESGRVSVEIENNENFDIEDISLALELSDLPFTSVGSSEKDVDDIDEDDEDTVSFTLRASTDIVPGDYNIPYTLTYINAENSTESFEKTGSFGLRVSAKTDLDFSIETNEDAVVGEEGRIIIEIINRGLGEVKSVSVEIIPNGFELLSKNKIFVGTIDSDDSDTATFDVFYKTQNPNFSVKIIYKDFDNNDQTETQSFLAKVYTKEEALELGLIQKRNFTLYLLIGVLVLGFIVYRIKKKRKKRV